jgi:hypothetical protein
MIVTAHAVTHWHNAEKNKHDSHGSCRDSLAQCRKKQT